MLCFALQKTYNRKEIIIPKGQKEHFKEMFGLGWDHIAGGIVER